MSESPMKKKLSFNDEVIKVDEGTLLEDLPVCSVTPPDRITMIVKPKKSKNLYFQMILLFFCAMISIGCDAFIFSSSFFGDIFGEQNNIFRNIVCFLAIVVHIIPEVFWGITIYKRMARLSNFTVLITTDKVIACGKGSVSECQVVKLVDLLDLRVKGNKVFMSTGMSKLSFEVSKPNVVYDHLKELYDSL